VTIPPDATEKTIATIEGAIQRLIDIGAERETATLILAFQCSLRLTAPESIKAVRQALNDAAVLAEPDFDKTLPESMNAIEYLAEPPIQYAIEQMVGSGLCSEAIGHALISRGAMHLSERMDPVALLEHLSVARDSIAEKIEETKRGAN
jgi:hypothetical protein